MDILSQADKDYAKQQLMNVFDTFARPHEFVVYHSPQEKVLAIDDTYNAVWDTGATLPRSNYEEIKKTIQARILFLDYEQQLVADFFTGKEIENIKVRRNLGELKVTVRIEDAPFIKQCQKVFFDGNFWDLKSDAKHLGIFSLDLTTFIFKRRE